MIFETTDIETGWNGVYKNRIVEAGIYVWVINYRTICTGDNEFRKTGHVMVLR
jgi:hypothetical protein